MKTILLTADEVALGAMHGIHRRYNKHKHGRAEREQGERSTWDNEIEGACAELAFCKHLGIYWEGLQQVCSTDGHHYEVRWTKHEHGGLILYPRDEDRQIFVLMGGFAPKYYIVGSLRGAAGKLEKWKDKRGYFLVPREFLRPPRTEP